MKKNGVFDSKIFKITVGIINVCLIIGLVSYLVLTLIHKNHTSSSPSQGVSVVAEKYSVNDTESAMNDAEDSMMDVYYMLLQGSTVDLGNNKVLHFETDGTFNGYFDDNNTNVSNYLYEVISESDDSQYVANVNIYNEDKTSVVQYKLSFDENSDMQLYYPDAEQTFKLEF